MKVLFFSPVKVSSDNTDIKGTGNWVSCLVDALFKYAENIELSLAYHDKRVKNVEYSNFNHTSIARIPSLAAETNFGKLIDNWAVKDVYRNSLDDYLEVIDFYKPDIIQIFGLEHPFIRIVGHTNIPVVIHLQGLLGPYSYKYCQRFSTTQLIFGTKKVDLLKGSVPHLYKRKIKKHLNLEKKVHDKCRYFLGRTEWDRLFARAFASSAAYFHCDEIMRPIFYERAWQKPQNNECRIFTTSTAGPYKNIDIIFETMKILNEFNRNFSFEWRIAGTNSNDRVINIMRGKGFSFENLTMLGRISSREIINEMQQADLFVYPSAIDNSPNALQEALLVGMPVISSNAGGIGSLIEHNRNGYLVPEGEPYSMAGAIIDLYNDEGKARKMGRNAREQSLKTKHPQVVVSSLIRSYSSILELHHEE